MANDNGLAHLKIHLKTKHMVNPNVYLLIVNSNYLIIYVEDMETATLQGKNKCVNNEQINFLDRI